MDEDYRELMSRTGLTGVAAEARDLVRAGTLSERESWGALYAISVSAVATRDDGDADRRPRPRERPVAPDGRPGAGAAGGGGGSPARHPVPAGQPVRPRAVHRRRRRGAARIPGADVADVRESGRPRTAPAAAG